MLFIRVLKLSMTKFISHSYTNILMYVEVMKLVIAEGYYYVCMSSLLHLSDCKMNFLVQRTVQDSMMVDKAFEYMDVI